MHQRRHDGDTSLQPTAFPSRRRVPTSSTELFHYKAARLFYDEAVPEEGSPCRFLDGKTVEGPCAKEVPANLKGILWYWKMGL